jgi:predicted lactoylglutathione lyase
MSIGAFSVSLAAKDIYKTKNFYEKLDFKGFAGKIAGKWSIILFGQHR